MKKQSLVLALICILGMGIYFYPKEYGDTKEYRVFLKMREDFPKKEKSEMMDETAVILKEGQLSFINSEGEVFWQSNKYWFVEDFDILDVDGDGAEDCLFSLYKSYSFFENSGKEDSPEVRCHLFLYTAVHERGKALWCSSNLPRPVLSFSLRQDTETKRPVLETLEGSYEDEEIKTPHTYTWEGWGFREKKKGENI